MPNKISHIVKRLSFALSVVTVLSIIVSFCPPLVLKLNEIRNWKIHNVSFLEILTGSILTLVVFSIYIEYKLKDDKNNSHLKNEPNKDAKNILREKYLHYHFAYSHISVFVITIIGLLFSAYSDVFYQQGDPVSPILNGLNHNASTFNLDSILPKKEDTTNIVFIVDESGSIDETKLQKDTSWITKACEHILDYKFPIKSDILDAIVDIRRDNSPSSLLKLKICELLISNRDSFLITNKNYQISLITYGKVADLHQASIPLSTDSLFKKFILEILSHRPITSNTNSTNQTSPLEQIENFLAPKGIRSTYKRPEMVLCLFSDYIQDNDSDDSTLLKSVIKRMAYKSTMFNLFYLEPNDSLKVANKLNALNIYERTLKPYQIHIESINNTIELHCSDFKSEHYVEYFIDKPFLVNSNLFIKSSQNRTNVDLKIIESDTTDNWREYSFNGKPIEYFESVRLNGDGPLDTLSYFGHVTKQFATTEIEFSFPDINEKISTQIIFKKALPIYIARIFFVGGVFITIVSLIYFFFLLQLLLAKYYSNKNRKEINIDDGELLIRDKITNNPLILVYLDEVPFEAFLGAENTIPKSIVNKILADGRLKDLSAITSLPHTEDEVRSGAKPKFTVRIGSNISGNNEFEVVDIGYRISISQKLLDNLNYQIDISNGHLKRKI